MNVCHWMILTNTDQSKRPTCDSKCTLAGFKENERLTIDF